MPKAVTLGDLVFDAVKSEVPMASVNEGMARAAVTRMVDALSARGWRILPPGLPSYAREPVKLEATSYFCPHCGTHKPKVGMSHQNAELPGLGFVGIMTIFCGEDSCRSLQTRIITPPIEARPAGRTQ